MRVGVLTTSYPRFPGDVGGSFVEAFARHLAVRGHRVEVLAPEPRTPPAVVPRATPVDVRWVRYLPRPLQRTFHGAGVPDNLRRDPLAWPGALAFPLALAAAARRRTEGWDALVSHFGLPCGPVGELVAGGRPHLCVWHSADVHLAARLPASARRWTDRPGLRHWTVTDEARRRLGLREAMVCPMGAELPEPVDRERARALLGVNGFVVGTLGRLVPIKGLDRLLEACAGIEAMTLLVGGDGPARPALEARARALGVRACFLGTVRGEQKAALLAAADVFAFPSRVTGAGFREGAPVALAEARLAGRPVIASAVGGLRERIAHGRDGLLVHGEKEAWRAALRHLRSDPELGHRLARAGTERDAALAWPSVARRAEAALEAAVRDAQGRTRRVPAGGR